VDRRRFLLAAVAAPLALRDVPAALAAGTGPVALVTADTEAHVAAVELLTGRIRARIPTRPEPFSIERAGPHAVVAHTVGGVVTVIDPRRLAVRHVVEGLGEPRYTAAAPDGRHAFVTDSGLVELLTLDVVAGRVVGRLKLSLWPRHISISPDGRTLWVGLGTAAPQVAVVDVSDPRRPRLSGHARPGFLAHDVGFDPAGAAVWVTSGAENTIAVHRDGSFRRLPADAPPQHVTFLDGRAFVTSGGSATLRVYEAATARLLRTTRIPVGSYNVQYAAGRVLTPSLNEGTLCVLDRSGRVRETVRVAASCHDACLA
jgi:DNA-binding beta-propeller fold protein YncE